MKNKFFKHISSHKSKWIIVLTALLLVCVFTLTSCTDILSDVNPRGWFEKDATQPVSAEKTYTFKMPAGDVELEARWARYSITINVDEQFKNAGTVTGGGYYTAGTTNIELKATTNNTFRHARKKALSALSRRVR